MKNHKNEEQQGKNNKEQEGNTHIRRITTQQKTVHVINTIEKTGARKE